MARILRQADTFVVLLFLKHSNRSNCFFKEGGEGSGEEGVTPDPSWGMICPGSQFMFARFLPGIVARYPVYRPVTISCSLLNVRATSPGRQKVTSNIDGWIKIVSCD